MTQEACTGGKCAACRTLAGICINALTSDSIIHRHDCQFAQRLLRMTTKKAVAQAQYPRPGRVRAADRSLLHISLIDMPKTELRILCAAIAEAAVRFYETPDHQADYERWLRLQEGGEGDRRDHSERASREISQSHAVGCCGAVSGPFPETALQIDRRRTEPV